MFIHQPRANTEPQDLGLHDVDTDVFLSPSICVGVNPTYPGVLHVCHLIPGHVQAVT